MELNLQFANIFSCKKIPSTAQCQVVVGQHQYLKEKLAII